MMSHGPLPGKVVAGGQARPLNVLGAPTMIFLNKADTGGAFALWETDLPPGVGIPPHVHHREDELFYVLAGRVRLMVGGQVHVAGAGTTIFAPRNVPHAITCEGDVTCRLLVTGYPGGIEEMYVELDRLPPGPPDMAKVVAIVKRYDIDFV